jgi:hypothetical protein
VDGIVGPKTLAKLKEVATGVRRFANGSTIKTEPDGTVRIHLEAADIGLITGVGNLYGGTLASVLAAEGLLTGGIGIAVTAAVAAGSGLTWWYYSNPDGTIEIYVPAKQVALWNDGCGAEVLIGDKWVTAFDHEDLALNITRAFDKWWRCRKWR